MTFDPLATWSVDAPSTLRLLATKGLLRGRNVGVGHVDACFQGVCASTGSHQATVNVLAP